MRAIVLHEYGGPEVLRVEDVPDPKPQRGEVIVEVEAVGVNPADALARRGERSHLTGRRPYIPGSDIAGRVVATGRNVGWPQPGERVFAMVNRFFGGAYAQRTAVAASAVAPIPGRLTSVEAAALPRPGLTALAALDVARIRQGDEVLVVGAGGSVGSLCVEMAAGRGGRVSAVCREGEEAAVRERGAAEIVAHDAAELAGLGRTWRVVIDTPGVLTPPDARRLLAPWGVHVTTRLSQANFLRSRLGAVWPGRRTRLLLVGPSGDGLERLGRALDAGAVHPLRVATTLPLERAAEAHRLLDGGGAGKIVLTVGKGR